MKSIVLLSGGLDSAVNLAEAVADSEVVLGITFDYGQRASQQEIRAAQKLLEHYGIKQEVIKLPYLEAVTHTSLVDKTKAVPRLAQDQLDDAEAIGKQSAASVWVPNRNGLFINIAATFAESMSAEQIVVGFNAEEAATFPDNSVAFIQAINEALKYSTQNQVQVKCYTQDLNKVEIVQRGETLNLPFQYIWSCYHGAEHMCGECESCQRLLRAMRLAGLTPPWSGGEN